MPVTELAKEPSPDFGVHLRQAVADVYRRKWLCALLLVLCVGTAAWRAWQKTPMYRAKASVIVEPPPAYYLNPALAARVRSTLLTEADRLSAMSEDVVREAAAKSGATAWSSFSAVSKKELYRKLSRAMNVALVNEHLELAVTWPNPKEAAALANGWAEACVSNITEEQQEPIGKWRAVVEKKLLSLKQKWLETKMKIREFENRFDFAPTDLGTGDLRRHFRSLKEKLAADNLKLQRLEAEAKRWREAKGNLNLLLLIPRTVNNNQIGQLKERLAKLEGQKSQLTMKYLPSSAKVAGIERKIAEARRELKSALEALAGELRVEMESLRQSNNSLKEQILKLKKALAGNYDRLLLEEQMARMHYETQWKQLQAAERTDPRMLRSAQVFEWAVPPSAPFSPDWFRELAYGLFVGLVLTAGALFLLDALDDTVGASRDHRLFTLAPTTLIPKLEDGVGNNDRWAVAEHFPLSSVVENLRALRASMTLPSGNGHAALPQVIVVCGPDRKSGKSFIASNLAILYAKTGEGSKENGVLLIDADMRTRALTKAFGLGDRRGLSDLLAEGGTAAEAAGLLETPAAVNFLPAGSPCRDIFEKLDSKRTAEFMREIRNRWGLIVIDTPALSEASDAFVFAGLADMTLTVARNRKTQKGRLIRTLSALAKTDTRGLHLVLNSIDEADWRLAKRLG